MLLMAQNLLLITLKKNNYSLTLFTMDFFGAVHGWGRRKTPPSLKSLTHILQCLNLAQLCLT